MEREAFETLAGRYIDGVITPDETAALNREIKSDPAAARVFLGLTAEHALLCGVFEDAIAAGPGAGGAHEAANVKAAGAISRPAFTPTPVSWRLVALIVLGFSLLWVLIPGEPGSGNGGAAPAVRMTSGSALVGGQPRQQIREGELFQAGDNGAAMRLANGTELRLAGGTQARIAGGEVELIRGKSDLKTGSGAALKMRTPAGKVFAERAEFSTEVRPDYRKGGSSMNKKLALALAVAVSAGNVRVDVGSGHFTVHAGENRVFASDGEEGNKDDGQQGNKDDGQKGDGQNNQKDDGQQNNKDDGQQNNKDDGQSGNKDDGQQGNSDQGETGSQGSSRAAPKGSSSRSAGLNE